MEATESPKVDNELITESQFAEKMKVDYPMDEEKLIDFLNCSRLKNSKVMLCPRCSFVFDKEVTKGLQNFVLKSKKKGKWYDDHRP